MNCMDGSEPDEGVWRLRPDAGNEVFAERTSPVDKRIPPNAKTGALDDRLPA